MLHCNSRAKLYSNCKLCAGRFLFTFSRDEKVMRERLEENTSEQLRLNTAVNTMTSESENSPRVCM